MKTQGEINNGQSRNSGNTGHKTKTNKINKHNTVQKPIKMGTIDPTKKRGEPR